MSPALPLSLTDTKILPAAGRVSLQVPLWFGLLLAVALLMLRQPYTGVRHDATLYLGQALARLDPAWASHDFYFQFGSQDRFSFFSRLFTWPVQAFGIGPAEIGTLFVCRTLGLAAVYVLTRDLPERSRWLAVLAVACLGHFYGDRRIFSVLEPFVTARTPAEPLAILGLAALVRGRLGLAAAGLAAAGACHPLVAVPAVVVAWLYLIGRDRRWAWAAAAALPIAALALAGVAPFHGLLARYDEQWFSVIANENSDVFVTLWSRTDLMAAVADLGVVWIATRGDARPLARLSRAAVAAAIALGLVSLIGSDFVHDVLITQLQLWRALWIVNLLAAVWVPSLVLSLWERGASGRLAAVAAATAYFSISEWAGEGWALAIWALAAWQITERRIALKPSILRLAMIASGVVAVVELGATAWSLLYQIAMERHGTALMHSVSIPFALPLLTLPLAGWLLWTRANGRHVVPLGAAVVVLGFVALAQYDQRTPFVQFEESATDAQRPFQSVIPEDATVYWEHLQLTPIWVLLHRAAFAGEGQFSGLLFNRGTAAVAMERLPLIMPALERTMRCQALQGWMQGGYHFQDCEETESFLRSICTAQPSHADYFVTQQRYQVAAPVSTWRFDPHDGTPAEPYYLYDCRTVPAPVAAAASSASASASTSASASASAAAGGTSRPQESVGKPSAPAP